MPKECSEGKLGARQRKGQGMRVFQQEGTLLSKAKTRKGHSAFRDDQVA